MSVARLFSMPEDDGAAAPLDVAEILPGDEDEKMTSSAIEGLLRLRHQPPEWSTFCEIPNGTGGAYNQRLDCFALNTYPSKGWHSIAYEIKVSRADFLRELRDPTKRMFAEKVSHQCFFAVAPGIARVDEIPESWGMVQATKGGLRMMKAAKQRDREPLPMSFMAALLRRDGEKPSGGVAMWLYCGREVGEEELTAIAREAGGDRLESEFRRKFREEEDFKRLEELGQAVRHRIDVWSPSAKDFTDWADAERRERDPREHRLLISRLEALQQDLESTLATLKQKEATT